MLGHIIEWFKDHIGLAFTLGIIAVCILIYGATRRFGFTASMNITNANQELIDSSYEKYNGVDLPGSEVISAIKQYQNGIPVTVYTGESVDTYRGDFKTSNNNRKSERYIKPSQIYEGSLLKNSDNEIVSLVFAKEGVLLTEASYKELLAKIIGVNPEDSTMDNIVKQIDELIKNKDITIQVLNKNIESLNTSVSNLQSQNSLLSGEIVQGKKVIASAITNKGIITSENESFATMASNIGKISFNDLESEVFEYDNKISNLSTSDYTINLIVHTKKIKPIFVVIKSCMYVSTSYGASNVKDYIITSTKYSGGDYTFSSQNWASSPGEIIFSDKTISIKVKMSMIYTGNYYTYKEEWNGNSSGKTTVSVYGL